MPGLRNRPWAGGGRRVEGIGDVAQGEGPYLSIDPLLRRGLVPFRFCAGDQAVQPRRLHGAHLGQVVGVGIQAHVVDTLDHGQGLVGVGDGVEGLCQVN